MLEKAGAAAPTKETHLKKLRGGYLAKASENPDFIRIVVRKKSDFMNDTLRLVVVDDSEDGVVSAIMGVIESKKVQTAVHAFRFAKKDWSMESANEWVAKRFES